MMDNPSNMNTMIDKISDDLEREFCWNTMYLVHEGIQKDQRIKAWIKD
jgi:hypothetical protein